MSYCLNCGAQTQLNEKYCASCSANLMTGQQQPEGSQGQQVDQINSNIENHLAKAIFSTICCCLPFGIAAIVFAGQVNRKIQQGDYEGAKESADKADLWANVSIGIGAMIIIVRLLIMAMVTRY